MPLTFENYRVKDIDGGKVYVTARCVENGNEAYAVVSKGSDAIATATQKFAKLS
jgi:hypothetical protein